MGRTALVAPAPLAGGYMTNLFQIKENRRDRDVFCVNNTIWDGKLFQYITKTIGYKTEKH